MGWKSTHIHDHRSNSRSEVGQFSTEHVVTDSDVVVPILLVDRLIKDGVLLVFLLRNLFVRKCSIWSIFIECEEFEEYGEYAKIWSVFFCVKIPFWYFCRFCLAHKFAFSCICQNLNSRFQVAVSRGSGKRSSMLKRIFWVQWCKNPLSGKIIAFSIDNLISNNLENALYFCH